MLKRLFRPNPYRAAAQSLYAAIVAQARQPVFYAKWDVPDTLDGRFEMIALHTFLVLRRLKVWPSHGRELGQALFDTMFADMDRNLRELGVGDLGVGRRVKDMAKGFYGRIAAYETGLADTEGLLEDALRRNVYGTLKGPSAAKPESVRRLADYVRAATAQLETQDTAELGAGRPSFPLLAGETGFH